MLLRMILTIVVLLGACAPDRAGQSRPETDVSHSGSRNDAVVAASTPLVAELLEMAGAGTCTDVVVLLPRGTSPHETEPTPRAVVAARDAALWVRVGLGFERLDDLGVEEVLDLAPLVDPVEGPHGSDPHFWQDPQRARRAVETLARHLRSLESCDPDEIAETTMRSTRRLEELGEWSTERFGTIPRERRRVVTFHESLRTMAQRFDIEVVATVVPSTAHEAEVPPRHLRAVAEALRTTPPPLMVLEPFDEHESGDLVDTLVRESGVEFQTVQMLMDNLPEQSTGPDEPGHDYLVWFRENVEKLVDAWR